MPDKRIKHFVFMRFFTFEDPKYPYDIYDVGFLTKQLLMAKYNALPSLENQTNKNFDLVFMVNPKFFDNPKYDFIFSALQCATTLPLKFIKRNELSLLVKDAFKEYDFVIQSKMDFDDFIFKDAVAETQRKVEECANVLCYGYCKGYTYYAGDLCRYDTLWKKRGHIGILQSLILKSLFAKNIPFMDIYSFSHNIFKDKVKMFLEKNGVEFLENMFQQNTSTDAYVYFKHDFTHNNLVTNPCDLKLRFQKQKKLTNEDGLTKEHLKSEFGFEYKLNSIE